MGTLDVVNGMGKPVRGSIQVMAGMLASVSAPVRDLARFGGDSLLAAVLAVLGGSARDDQASEETGDVGEVDAEEMSPTEMVTHGLLAGDGRYTRLQVAQQVGMSIDDARRLWRAVGFAEVGDEERAFTSADVAALKDVAELITSGVLDIDGTITLARPFGHAFSRLAAVQTGFLSDVLGSRIAADQVADDPLLSERITAQALEITHELLPVLERVTLYLWRRHLATEAGRALLPAAHPDTRTDQPAAVGFIDICGFTRLSRGLGSAELADLLEPFETMMLDIALAHGGKVIKNVGDEVMFVADDAASAARIALDAFEQVAADDRRPTVHAGLAWGPVLYRGGDVFGDVVNTAARITGLARRGTIRVDDAMADALDAFGQFHVARRVPRRVRGYSQLHSYRLGRRSPVGKDDGR